MLPALVAALRRDGELEMSDAAAALLSKMGSATIDVASHRRERALIAARPQPHQTGHIAQEPDPDPHLVASGTSRHRVS